MSALTELQVQLIRGDIRQGGVEMTELLDDLLDHACCALEAAMADNPQASFEELYPDVRAEVCPDGWFEIQAETTFLLTYKNKKMKRLNHILGIAGSLLLIVGSVMKFNHFMGAAVALVLGGLVLATAYFPTLLVLALRTPGNALSRVRQISGPAAGGFLVLGTLFRIMHWPGASALLYFGLALFGLVFLPLYFVAARKEGKLNLQPLSLGVLLLAGASVTLSFTSIRPSQSHGSVAAGFVNTAFEDAQWMQAQVAALDARLHNTEAYRQHLAEIEAMNAAAAALLKHIDVIKTQLENGAPQEIHGTDDEVSARIMLYANIGYSDPLLVHPDANGGPSGASELKQEVAAFAQACAALQGGTAALPDIFQLHNREWMHSGPLSWELYHFGGKSYYVIFTNLARIEQGIAQLKLASLSSIAA